MSARRGAVARWGLVVVWAAIIFLASTDRLAEQRTAPLLERVIARICPHLDAETIEAVHTIARKLGHVVEYAVLGWLLSRALDDGRGWQPRHAVLAVVLAASYAVTDELHQHFVRGRTAAVGDVAIDVLGAAAAQVLVAAWRRRPRPA